ncbi:MAG: hypothetical protein ACREM1_23015 [Longimicrobiales bacterium]
MPIPAPEVAGRSIGASARGGSEGSDECDKDTASVAFNLPYWLTAVLAATVVATIIAADPDDSLPSRAARLFIDDAEIEAMQGLQRVFHHPRRHAGNPLLTGTEPWEKWTVEVNGRSVLYDEESREFKMWYVSPLIGVAGAAYGELFRTAYAVSRDGVHWTKPELGQVEWDGSRRNNLIRWGENWMRRPNVVKDPHDPDPVRRYKMIYSDFIEGRTALVKAYSIDGIHWRLNGDGQPWFRRTHNSDLLGWDPSIQQYVHYVRMPGSPTSIGRSTSQDFVTWTQPETVLAPDGEEAGVNFQGLAAFRYEGLYLGLIRVRTRIQGAWAGAYVELTVSRDGIDWVRPSSGNPFFQGGEASAWDSAAIIMTAPVVHDGKIWFYYTGENHPYSKEALIKVQRGWQEKGQRMQRAIGLAMLRLDGFASLDAGPHGGWVTTRPLTVASGALEVNADVSGMLRVEILGKDGEPLEGFEAESCRPVQSDALSHPISWDTGADMGSLVGKDVQLRFWLRDGSLYSFRFR